MPQIDPDAVVCISCQNYIPMNEAISVGELGTGFVYCKQCVLDSLKALEPLIKFMLYAASGVWYCETCVWADLDDGDLHCCKDGLGRHKTFVISKDSEDTDESSADQDIWTRARGEVYPCNGYRNEKKFQLRAVPWWYDY
jgi:hypothetical protein